MEPELLRLNLPTPLFVVLLEDKEQDRIEIRSGKTDEYMLLSIDMLLACVCSVSLTAIMSRVLSHTFLISAFLSCIRSIR